MSEKQPVKCSDVGGQAVIEGVMMRSPNSFVVACRRPSGEIVLREQRWHSLWHRFKFLKWPFMRGGVVLLEALVNGMSALTFSANQQEIAEEGDGDGEGEGNKAPEPMSPAAVAGMVALSVVFAMILFVGLPHLLTWLVGFDTDSLAFHLVDGAFKVLILVGYIAAIGTNKEIARVFMYHGAEHKTIWAYEKDRELTVENVREESRFHPRCGTSFLVLVILVSVFLFAVLLQYPLSEYKIVDHLLKILIKIPLMFPVAGLAYEGIKLSGKHRDAALVKAIISPGLWLQRLTTREPDDDQLEIAILSLRKTLWREGAALDSDKRGVEVFEDFAAAIPATET